MPQILDYEMTTRDGDDGILIKINLGTTAGPTPEKQIRNYLAPDLPVIPPRIELIDEEVLDRESRDTGDYDDIIAHVWIDENSARGRGSLDDIYKTIDREFSTEVTVNISEHLYNIIFSTLTEEYENEKKCIDDVAKTGADVAFNGEPTLELSENIIVDVSSIDYHSDVSEKTLMIGDGVLDLVEDNFEGETTERGVIRALRLGVMYMTDEQFDYNVEDDIEMADNGVTLDISANISVSGGS